jgi:hypothetical protein
LNDGDPLFREYPFKEIIMGKPIQKKYFGVATTPGSQIVVSGVKWADGTTATSDYIVKQTGSHAYVVSNGTKSETCFMVNATDVADLNPNECFILATPFGGSALPCKKIMQYRLDLYEADGSVGSYSWSAIPATGLGQADLIAGTGTVGALLTLAVNVAGTGYFTAPAVTLTGGGVGGAAHVTVAGATGAVATAVIDTAGTGYSGATLAAPPASVTATLARSVTNGVLGLTVNNAGTNGYYNAVPSITIDPPPAAVTATATASLTADAVTSITLAAPGFGGGFYTSAPAVTVGVSDLNPGLAGNATATAVLTNGAITSFIIAGGNNGYTGAPAISIDAPPAAVAGAATAVLTAHRVSSVAGVAGSGYFTAPNVVVGAPDVAPVQATLTSTFSV